MSKKELESVSKIQIYLEQQNRPYSVNDIFLNLHKDVGKTAVQKSLDQLVQDGSVKEKTYGKQKVYVASQEKFPSLNDAELKEMDVKIGQLTEDLKAGGIEIQAVEAQLRMLGDSLTTEEARKKSEIISLELEQLQERLQKLRNSQVIISDLEKERAEHEHSKMMKEWRKRRRIALDILGAILEGYPKSKKELFDEIGIETDEDAGVSLAR